MKKQKGIPPTYAGHAIMESEDHRIVSNSEAGWTDADDEAF